MSFNHFLYTYYKYGTEPVEVVLTFFKPAHWTKIKVYRADKKNAHKLISMQQQIDFALQLTNPFFIHKVIVVYISYMSYICQMCRTYNLYEISVILIFVIYKLSSQLTLTSILVVFRSEIKNGNWKHFEGRLTKENIKLGGGLTFAHCKDNINQTQKT